MPAAVKTASNAMVNFGIAVADQEPEPVQLVNSVQSQ
jgi:hypothetical protein